MQIADQVENTSNGPRKVFTGIENFHPTAVNPTKEELVAMGIPAQTDPVYHGKVSRTYGEGEKEYDFFSIRVFLDNNDPNNPIRTQVQYTVIRDEMFSSTGKYKVINAYGSDAWLEEDHIKAGTLPANMQWFVIDGVKKCFRGEESLITFVKSLRNLPNVTSKTKTADKAKGVASFSQSDLEDMFKGNFKAIRNVIMDSKDSKVGYLLGVKNVEGTNRQSLYARLPLKAYVKHIDAPNFLINHVTDAQDNGSYSDTIFDLADLTLKEYEETQASGDLDDNLPFGSSDNGVDSIPYLN